MSELCPPCGTSGSPSMGPYQRHYYRLGSVIRNTVSQAQDTLCRIQLGHIQRMLNNHYAKEVGDRTNYHINDHETGNPIWSTTPGWATEESKNRGLYPKSLGELCIELAQETLLEGVSVVPAFPGHRVAYIEWTQITDRFPNLEVNISISRRDIQKLRETMYYKKKNHCVGDGIYDNTEYFQNQLDQLIEKERKTARLGGNPERLIELVRNA